MFKLGVRSTPPALIFAGSPAFAVDAARVNSATDKIPIVAVGKLLII
jgi:hypothetical protein|tara:strand:+ start:1238 stop:1378 length:141 start_codon:yes stop_codon:yes gene_type:complete